MISENRQRGPSGREKIGQQEGDFGGGRANAARAYHGWWVVFCTFVMALYGWGLGFYGLSLYLVALTKTHGWSPATISAGITFYYIVGAFLVMQVGDAIQKSGARIVVLAGVGPDGRWACSASRSSTGPGSSTSPSW